MVWRISALVGILFACGQYGVAAQPTWPASTDELEDIIFLNTGYRARGFADPVTPCSTGVAPGRITAAEFIRTAFHDMASGNTYTGIGGLDGSIIFETGLAENVGAGFVTTLSLYAPFFSSRTSISDIIAAGVYTATRSCGGPIIPIRGGHKDATEAGPSGAIPLPQNALGTFKNQFLRVGYNATEMISFVACGHTLGGVHSPNFPDIVPPGTAPDDFAVFDTTSSTFDSRLPIEFVAGTTIDPLVRSNTKKNSDTVVFTSDTNNATIKSMQDPTTFANICKDMFQRMIEVVPAGVTLSDPVTAYEVKPYDIQLTLQDGASTIAFTGDVRIRTTQRSVAEVQLNYKDHTGATVANPISTIYKGDAKGFDSTFSFFSFDATLPAQDSISSFNVVVIVSGGTSEVFTNNGNGFKVDDSILYQAPQSCLDGSGKLTVVAAVRNTSSSSPSLSVVVKNPRSSVIIPALSTATAAMATQSAVGAYQLYSASYQFSGSQAQSAVFGVVAGSSSDNDKNTSWLPTACSPLSSSTPSSTPPTSSYSFQGCYTDAGGSRALSGAASYDDAMTVEKCAAACTQFQLFGLEYGRECYCGNTLDASSVIAGLSDCSMACSGNSNQRCGAASRLSTYKNLNYVAPVNTNITGYSYIGCYSEGTATRALSDGSTTSDAMTVKSCSTFCSGAAYFGLEYGRECYCGSKLQDGSTLQAATDCSMLCSGNTTEYCGLFGVCIDIDDSRVIHSHATVKLHRLELFITRRVDYQHIHSILPNIILVHVHVLPPNPHPQQLHLPRLRPRHTHLAPPHLSIHHLPVNDLHPLRPLLHRLPTPNAPCPAPATPPHAAAPATD
ncbi:heme peroxidase [Lophiostoma macrostomum CBS 122681]|uniref:Heme peroxidase n=1 Tax=Lophiostoma macrostomum CBS 122681 TaxID=1314788 RepID=A0A6A6SXE0_9PLEO|nr:heme peroxidase [Lophiostoma macrostomum CBS 122681]